MPLLFFEAERAKFFRPFKRSRRELVVACLEAIVEAFLSMQDDLDKERKVITKQWAKRQEQIERVMSATVGMGRRNSIVE